MFLGRRDAQIKTRGYRVELGEIESALYSLPAVVECAVVAIPDEAVTNRLKAFVVTREAADRRRARGPLPRAAAPLHDPRRIRVRRQPAEIIDR